MAPDNAPPITSLDELLAFRDKTERISGLLNKRLKGHLATLSPVLTPRRVFGKYVGARDTAPRADEAYAQLAERFKEVCGSPFDFRQDLDEEALSAVDSGIEVYPWEYTYEVQGSKGAKTISMTSPVRWIVTYGSEYTPGQLRDLVRGGSGERRSRPARNFLVNALAFHLVLTRIPGAEQLLKDLRYEISARPLPGLGKLPLVMFSIPLPFFRPPDDLLLTAIRLSGVSAFIELIDAAAVRGLDDPLRRQIEGLLEQA